MSHNACLTSWKRVLSCYVHRVTGESLRPHQVGCLNRFQGLPLKAKARSRGLSGKEDGKRRFGRVGGKYIDGSDWLLVSDSFFVFHFLLYNHL